MGNVVTDGGTFQSTTTRCADVYLAAQNIIQSRTGAFPTWLNGGTCTADPVIAGSSLQWPAGGGWSISALNGTFTNVSSGSSGSSNGASGTGTTSTSTGATTITVTLSPFTAGSDYYTASVTLVGAFILVAIGILGIRWLIDYFRTAPDY